MGRFFPYLGGKTHLIDDLLKLIPSHQTYVEVFGGSGELLFSKTKSKHEVFNDINQDLINLFLQVRDNLTAVQSRLEYLPNSRELYETWTRDFKNGLSPSDPIERAARFYYILCNQFAGKMYGGWAFGHRLSGWSENRIKKLPAISKRLERVYVDCSDFRKLIATWDSQNTFLFCDPPYLDTVGYKQGFNEKDHRDLAEILRNTKGKWILTINDHPLFHDLYSEYIIDMIDIQLSIEKMENNDSRKTYSNLIIRNYDSGDISQSILGNYLFNPALEANK